ncbi:MAG: putative sugar phosphatases of the HAD superfamily [Rhodobacteraceae bacterium HLUCCA12]|nr:MAG: putative sugar phosphatases of the HAD superfamily [Rhodobacteraceae bacterium HLUCCA12]
MTDHSAFARVDLDWAFDRYEALRSRLPQAAFSGTPRKVEDLSAVFDRYDGFVLDAFGVLNVGETAIPGAVERIAQMRAAGKRVVVLTNGASYPRASALAKYARLGFDFTPDEVVASRDLAAAALAGQGNRLWAAITAAGATFDDLPTRITALDTDPALLARAEGFLFLGSEGWTPQRQAALKAALSARPRPVVVANPDIVAPREDGLTLEPGHFAHDLPGFGTPMAPEFHGKPFGGAFDAALARLGDLPRERVAMVGDTLHTDVLGGRAAGLGTVLIAAHGLFKGLDPAPYIARSGIVPDVIATTT